MKEGSKRVTRGAEKKSRIRSKNNSEGSGVGRLVYMWEKKERRTVPTSNVQTSDVRRGT